MYHYDFNMPDPSGYLLIEEIEKILNTQAPGQPVQRKYIKLLMKLKTAFGPCNQCESILIGELKLKIANTYRCSLEHQEEIVDIVCERFSSVADLVREKDGSVHWVLTLKPLGELKTNESLLARLNITRNFLKLLAQKKELVEYMLAHKIAA